VNPYVFLALAGLVLLAAMLAGVGAVLAGGKGRKRLSWALYGLLIAMTVSYMVLLAVANATAPPPCGGGR
jgi:hypothetical protein